MAKAWMARAITSRPPAAALATTSWPVGCSAITTREPSMPTMSAAETREGWDTGYSVVGVECCGLCRGRTFAHGVHVPGR